MERIIDNFFFPLKFFLFFPILPFSSKKERFISLLAFLSSVKCDVLVVGASSAGLTAATAAAMGGASVILLDKDLDGFHHVANTLFEGMAAHSGIMVSDCYLKKELQGMRIISPGGAAVTIAAKGYFIDRQTV